MLNSNIGCFEMKVMSATEKQNFTLNSNIGCFEINLIKYRLPALRVKQ